MKRKAQTVAGALGTFCLLLMACNPNSVMDDNTIQALKRPNIVFVFADDLGWGEIEPFGQKVVRTPNLNTMADKGMKFTSFYSSAPVCGPSRISLLTGKHTGNLRVDNNSGGIASYETNLAHDLKEAGYDTAVLGKWGVGQAQTKHAPNKHGFDYSMIFKSGGAAHRHYPKYFYENGVEIELKNNHLTHGDTYSDNLVFDKAIEYIRGRSDAKDPDPFLLYLPITLPHADIVAPTEVMEKYDGRFEETPYLGDFYTPQSKPKAATAAMLELIDLRMGDLLKQIDEAGYSENTLVIFTSDNGAISVAGRDHKFFKANGSLRGMKTDIYEGGIRVPFIAYWPGQIPAGTVSDTPSVMYDMRDTFADIAGSTPKVKTDGRSLLPIFLEPELQTDERILYWSFSGGKHNGFPDDKTKHNARKQYQAARKGKFKAHRIACKRDELYDLEADVREEVNLIDSKKNEVIELFEFIDGQRCLKF